MCFTSYGVVRILGGPARSTIETEIYFRAMQLGDVSGALVLSILQLIVVVVLILLITQFSTPKSTELGQMIYSRIRKPQTSDQKILIALVAFTSALVVIMPLIGVVRRSILVGQDVNFSIWQSVFKDAQIFKSLTTSVKYAAFTIVVSTTIGLFGACAIIYGSKRYKFLNLTNGIASRGFCRNSRSWNHHHI